MYFLSENFMIILCLGDKTTALVFIVLLSTLLVMSYCIKHIFVLRLN